MPSCVLRYCLNNSGNTNKVQGITFHLFPVHEIKREDWRKLVAKERSEEFYKPNKSSVICSDHFLESDIYHTTKGYKRLKKTAVPHIEVEYGDVAETSQAKEISLEVAKSSEKMSSSQSIPGSSGAARTSASPAASDDDFSWPESKRDNEKREDSDDESNASDQQQEESETEEGEHVLEITEIKLEPSDEIELEGIKTEPQLEVLNTILGSDGGAGGGFRPFVRATNLNLPRINLFAVVEFIAGNDSYAALDYDKLKAITTTNNQKLVSGLRVQNREFVHRVRCTVHLASSSQCGVEYDIATHTVTRSECMCACATCEHVAALLLWLLCVSNQKDFDTKHVLEDNVKPKPPNTKVTVPTHWARSPDTKVSIFTHSTKPLTKPLDTTVMVARSAKPLDNKVMVARSAKPLDTKETMARPAKPVMLSRSDVGAVHPSAEDSEVSVNEPDDPLDVSPSDLVEDQPGPSTAKRKKVTPATPGHAATLLKTKSTSRDTDTKSDDTIIKCSFTRKCFFNVWRSTKGNFHEKLRHTRSIMTKAFHDANYVIDFLPLERRLEELCLEIEGYGNVEGNRDGFEAMSAEWFSAVENIDMRKTKRDIDPGPSKGFGVAL